MDSFIVFEGEHALLELVGQLDGKRDFKKVPNLIYRENNVTKVNEPFYAEDLNKLPTPDFDGFPLRLYHAPASVLPIQTSRDVTMGNVPLQPASRPQAFSFASDGITHGRYLGTFSKYDTPYFFFTDESVPINKLREISQGLLESNGI